MNQILACVNDGKELYIRWILMYLFYKFICTDQQSWNDWDDFHFINQEWNIVVLFQRSDLGIEINIYEDIGSISAIDWGVLDMSDMDEYLSGESLITWCTPEDLYNKILGKVDYIFESSMNDIIEEDGKPYTPVGVSNIKPA